MFELIFSKEANNDIVSTLNYLNNTLKSPVAADNLLTELERHEEILENTPNIYPHVPNEYLASMGYRFTMVKNYMMFYIINENEKTVDVIRFLHGRRDWANILN